MKHGRTINQAAAEAYASQRLYEFLTGKRGYAYPSDFPQIDVPIDWTIAIPAIYALYGTDEHAKDAYEQAIRQALSGTAEDVWCGGNILYFQRNKEMEGKSPFTIDKTLLTELRKQIMEKKDDMQAFYPYGKNGWNAYEDILRLQHSFVLDWDERMW